MSEMNGNMFTHDGEHGRCCNGCDCDKYYYYYGDSGSGSSRGGGNSGGGCLGVIFNLLVIFGVFWFLAATGIPGLIFGCVVLAVILLVLGIFGKFHFR